MTAKWCANLQIVNADFLAGLWCGLLSSKLIIMRAYWCGFFTEIINKYFIGGMCEKRVRIL